jgi:murein L,D-transpeptidase YafK
MLTSCAGYQFPFDAGRILGRIDRDLKSEDVYIGDPVFIRIFKEENILELWMKGEDSRRYTLIKSYPICKWSGTLGPKFREGDKQAPEGFYATDLMSLNPNSAYHLSFNINFPNAYDMSLNRTGSFIMVHGGCQSEGCYAITDRGIEEIYILVERALGAGQKEIPVHVFPFRMSEERLRREQNSAFYHFWRNLKQGYDFFERYGVPPRWTVRNGQYDFY